MDVADDGILLLAAYAKWGDACPDFLLGEFAFAIWDERLRRLFCCRDHIGFRSFLYWGNQTRFIFAGDIEPILQFPDVPAKLNRRKLAALAIRTGECVYPEETFHEGIFSLPPGSCMTVEPGRTRQWKYWELKPDGGQMAGRRPEEQFEALRELLFRSVECRLDRDHPVAAAFSGGLDSSAIVAIAAGALAKRNRELTAIAAVLPEESKPQFTDEREYMEEFRSWPNVRIQYVTASGRGPFDALNDSSRFRSFFLRTSRFYLTDECEKIAVAGGSRSLLSGSFGEFGPSSWGERYHLELALKLRLPTLFREMKNSRTCRSSSPLRALAGQLRRMLTPRLGIDVSLPFTRDFQQECEAKPVWRSRSPWPRRHQAASIRYWLGKHAVERGQSVNLVRPSFPLIDKRILEFCLALPCSMDVGKGYQRFPVRAALDGILPPRIQWRTGKMHYSPDYYVRYNAQLGMAQDFVAAIGARDPVRTIVDVERLGKMLAPVDPAVGLASARDEVPMTLYLIGFLRQFSEFRP